MLLVPSLLVRSICFFLIGFSGFKNSTAYVWGSECVPFKKRAAVFTVINVVDALPTVITGLFYLFIKPDWFPVYAFNIALSTSGLILAFACPESPRWLLYSGKQAHAIEALNYLAWLNGKDKDCYIPSDAEFEETIKVQEIELVREENSLFMRQEGSESMMLASKFAMTQLHPRVQSQAHPNDYTNLFGDDNFRPQTKFGVEDDGFDRCKS